MSLSLERVLFDRLLRLAPSKRRSYGGEVLRIEIEKSKYPYIMETTDKLDNSDNSRNATSNRINARIDKMTKGNIKQLSHNFKSDEVEHHIEELEKEWDIDRTLMANASTLILAGVVLGSKVNKKWFILPGVVASFLLWHAVQGWCPPLPLFRKLGYRSRKEIDIEKNALKALKGDFADLKDDNDLPKDILVDRAFHAAKK